MTPTDLETLRGLVEQYQKYGICSCPDKTEYEALTALLADYERMRDFVLVAFHKAGCMANTGNGSFDAAGNFSHTTGDCTCGLDALRATLKGEKHE